MAILSSWHATPSTSSIRANKIHRTVGYLIGRQFGYQLLLHYQNHLGLTEGRIKLGQYLFLNHGGKIIFVAQFAPVLRAPAGLLAGANVMPWRKFMLANVISSCVWATSYGYAAYGVGHEFKQMQSQIAIVLVVIILAALMIFAAFVRRYEAQLVDRAETPNAGPSEAALGSYLAGERNLGQTPDICGQSRNDAKRRGCALMAIPDEPLDVV